jgi:molecular chaperone DnaJ
LIKEPCKKCNGKGYYKQKKSIKVKIPPGINDGDSIRIEGKGSSLGKDSINGDLFVTISVLPEKNFKRSGNDIISDIEISFTQAILGTKIEFETLDGTEEIVIDPGTQPNTRIILKSRGMVEFNGYRRGDLIINVNVKIPTRLTKDELESLKAMALNHGELVGDGSKSFFASLKDAFRK